MVDRSRRLTLSVLISDDVLDLLNIERNRSEEWRKADLGDMVNIILRRSLETGAYQSSEDHTTSFGVDRVMALWICHEFHDCIVDMFDGKPIEDIYEWGVTNEKEPHLRKRAMEIYPSPLVFYRTLRHAAKLAGFTVGGQPFPPEL